jgi:hypothetical protein
MANQSEHRDDNARSIKLAVEARKLGRFRDLARHANDHAPYPARIIKEREIDLNNCMRLDFPVLTKAMLMTNYDDIVTDRLISKQVIADFLGKPSDPKELLFDKYVVLHTSGTSREVGYFVYGKAVQQEIFEACGVTERQCDLGCLALKGSVEYEWRSMAQQGATMPT